MFENLFGSPLQRVRQHSRRRTPSKPQPVTGPKKPPKKPNAQLAKARQRSQQLAAELKATRQAAKESPKLRQAVQARDAKIASLSEQVSRLTGLLRLWQDAARRS